MKLHQILFFINSLKRAQCANFTFLSASFRGNICKTPAGEVIVAVAGLVDVFVLYADFILILTKIC